MKKIVKDALILFVITIIAGVLLGAVYKITKEPIATQNEKTKLAAYNSVFDRMDTYENIDDLSKAQDAIDESSYDGVTINEAVMAYDSNKALLGYIITVTDANGYGGDIKMTVGIDAAGVITGLEFLDINETAGLGMKAKQSSFKDQFIGHYGKVNWTKAEEKSEDEIDAISSATITTKAVTSGVNGALAAYTVLGGESHE